MSLCRVFVLAEISRVKSRQFTYASCSTCCSKVFLRCSDHSDQSTLQWYCAKCRVGLSPESIHHRYRISFTITDGSICCDVTVFGQNLEPYFGLSAARLQRYMSSSQQSTGVANEAILKDAVERKFVGNFFLFGFKTNPFCRTNSQKARHSPVKLSSVLMHYGKGVEVDERKSIVAWQMLPADDGGDTASVVTELSHMLNASSQNSCASSADESSLLSSAIKLSQWSRMDNRKSPSDAVSCQATGEVSLLSWDGSTLDFEQCETLPCGGTNGNDCQQATEGTHNGELNRSVIKHVEGTEAAGQAGTDSSEECSMDCSSLLICSEDLHLLDQCHMSPPSGDTTHLCQRESLETTQQVNKATDTSGEKHVSKIIPLCTSNDSKSVTDVSSEQPSTSYDEMPESEDLDAFLRQLPPDASLNEHQLCGLAVASGSDDSHASPEHELSKVMCATSCANVAKGSDSSCDEDVFVDGTRADKNKPLNNNKHSLFTNVYDDDADIISPSQRCVPWTDRDTAFRVIDSYEHQSLPDLTSSSLNCSSDLFDSSSSGDNPTHPRHSSPANISSTQEMSWSPPPRSMSHKSVGITNRRVSVLRRNVHFARRLSSVQSVEDIDRRMTSTPAVDTPQDKRRSCLKAATIVSSYVASCDDAYDGSQDLFSTSPLSGIPTTGVCAPVSLCHRDTSLLTRQAASPLLVDVSTTRQVTKQDSDYDRLHCHVTKMGSHIPSIHDTFDSPDLFSDSSSQALSESSLEVQRPCHETSCDLRTAPGGYLDRSDRTRRVLGDLANTDSNVIDREHGISGQFNLCSQDLFSQSIEATDMSLCRKLF